MLRCLLAIAILFLGYEGFFLLPRWMVVIPGAFRMSDALLLSVPLLLLFFFRRVAQAVRAWPQAAFLVLFGFALFLLTPLLAQANFDQPYLRGLVALRLNATYLLYFVFAAIIANPRELMKFVRWITVFLAIYLFLLVLAKYFPRLDIVYPPKADWYFNAAFRRYGEHRLFFPYGLVPAVFFFLALTHFLYGAKSPESGRHFRKLQFLYMLLFAYCIMKTGTRILVFSIPLVCLIAVMESRNRKLMVLAGLLFAAVLLYDVSAPLLRGSDLGNSRLGRMLFQNSQLKAETGRELQHRMYMENFLRYPLAGAGTLIPEKSLDTRRAYARFGIFPADDTGFSKMAGEYGLLGIVWVLWFFVFCFRKTTSILRRMPPGSEGSAPFLVTKALRYYYMFLLLTFVTLPHFLRPEGIIITMLSLAMLRAAEQGALELGRAVQQPLLQAAGQADAELSKGRRAIGYATQ
ncbi:MAG: hypothetical protein A2075_11495 [Geobacteraceae bacterium GWC2_58_44]|nr:MAG: hypothetical protein A2075_11495 [Geobacteraceae bacterium GWC2_58_44]HBG04826.1 hypothetical protein [Geobacter sp.]